MEEMGDSDVKQRKQQNKLKIWDKDDSKADIIAPLFQPYLLSSSFILFLFGQKFAAFCGPSFEPHLTKPFEAFYYFFLPFLPSSWIPDPFPCFFKTP